MNKTPILWVKNPDGSQGYTWNPITGCLNGCEYCYARKLANGRLRSRYLNNLNVACDKYDIKEFEKAVNDPFYPRFWRERLAEVFPPRPEDKKRHFFENRRDKGIFVCDMSDLFGIGIPEEWTRLVLEAIRCNDGDRFYLLTKQPQNLAKFSPFPNNCWVGFTATNQDMLYEGSLYIRDIEAKVKYVSLEPCLDFTLFHPEDLQWVNWVIIGACTGRKYELLELCQKWNIESINQGTRLMQYEGNLWTLQPKIEWVEEIVRACDKAGVPVFCKDNLVPLLYQLPQSCIGWTGYGEQVRRKLRQEMPDGTS